MSEPIKKAIDLIGNAFTDAPPPEELSPTSQEGLYCDPAGDLYIPVGMDEKGRPLISPYMTLDESHNDADLTFVKPSDWLPVVTNPETGDSVCVAPGMSVSVDKETGAVQINVPDFQLEQVNKWAEKNGIAAREIPNILFQIMKGEIYNHETEKWMTPEEIRNWGYKKIFKGNLDEKVMDWTTKDSEGIEWYEENKVKILDNFKNNFKAHAGAFGLSIFSLMGMGELADFAGIKEPSLRLAFVLGPLPAVEKISRHVISTLRGPRNIIMKGYRTASGLFKPNIFMGPILEIELPEVAAKTVSGNTALAVESNLVSIKFRLNGAGAKEFFKGLVNQIFPAGETTLIRTGRTFIGALKFPVHLYKTFLHMGCGVVVQTVWNQTLGHLIPNDFLWGLPKHFMDLFTLFVPNIAVAVAPRALSIKIAGVVNNPFFKVVGAGLVLDVSAMVAVGLVNIGHDESTMYIMSTYMRAGEKTLPFLRHIPSWVPFKTYFTILFGALNRKEVEKIEALDHLLSSGATGGVKGQLMKILVPNLNGEEWIAFADQGGFRNASIDFLKTWGETREKIIEPKRMVNKFIENLSCSIDMIKDGQYGDGAKGALLSLEKASQTVSKSENFMSQFRLLLNLSGMPENKMIDECIDDWVTDIDDEDFSEELSSKDRADEELLDEECKAKFSLWISQELTDVDCGDDEEACNAEIRAWATHNIIEKRKKKFATDWVKTELDTLAYVHYKGVTEKRLGEVYESLKSFGIDPQDRRGPLWDYAKMRVTDIEKGFKGSDFDPTMVEKMSLVMALYAKNAGENKVAVLKEVAAYTLWLESHVVKISSGLPAKIDKLKSMASVLREVVPGGTNMSKADSYDKWTRGILYAQTISRFASKTDGGGNITPGITALIENTIKDIGILAKEGKPVDHLVNDLRIIYPELVLRQFKSSDDNQIDFARIKHESLTKQVGVVLKLLSAVKISAKTKSVLKSKGIEKEKEIVHAFTQVASHNLRRHRSRSYKDYKVAFDRAWNNYQAGTSLTDVSNMILAASTLYKTIDHKSSFFEYSGDSAGLNREHLMKKVVSNLQSENSDMKSIIYADDLRLQSIGNIKKSLDMLLVNWFSYMKKAAPGKTDAEKFTNGWAMMSHPALSSIKRTIVDATSQYYFLINQNYFDKYIDPSKLELGSVSKRLKNVDSLDETEFEMRFTEDQEEIQRARNYLAKLAHKGYGNFFVRLMSTQEGEVLDPDKLWIRNVVQTNERIDKEYTEIIGGRLDVTEATEHIKDPEIRSAARSAIYSYEDYGRFTTHEPDAGSTPDNITTIPPAEPSREGYLKMALKLIKFKLAWRVTELNDQNLLEPKRFSETKKIIAKINEIENSDDLLNRDLHYEVTTLINKAKIANKSIILEIFNRDGSLKADQTKLFKHVAAATDKDEKKKALEDKINCKKEK